MARPKEAKRSPLAPARTLRARSLPEPVKAAPIIKWVGGKSRLLDELVARAPRKYGRYVEPFVGGGALFFRLAPRRAVLGDGNLDLISMYQQLARDPAAIIRQLTLYRAGHSEQQYYETRARWNDKAVAWTPPGRAAAFIYLNKTCFNGLWRVNRSGAFNVPMGRYAEPTIFDPTALVAAGQALQRAQLRHGDFRAVAEESRPGDFAYFDPPYDPLTPTANFTSYTEGDFGAAEQEALADLAHKLVERGVHVMLSNHDTPRIRRLYRGLTLDVVQCGRAINSNAARRGSVAEVIVTGTRG